MSTILLKDATFINEGKKWEGDLYVENGRIARIDSSIEKRDALEIDASGLLCMPGIIDDQVHFREPGMTYKASIKSESMAGLAGGVTSFMEMPNTKPPALTQELLENKYEIGAADAWANYSFFMGASNDNLEEVLRTNAEDVCGVKVFMGSSTGNMLVDDREVLEKLFSQVPMLIATHCEDEQTIRDNLAKLKGTYGDRLSAKHHPIIRSVEGCLLSSGLAVKLARKYGTRLHVLHISTGDELVLFDKGIPLAEKKITAEVCVHHLYFDASQYDQLGNQIKCNPAIKEASHKALLMKGLLDDVLDIIATDHAPHTWDEKCKSYLDAPSGLPLIQHSLNVMLDFHKEGKISLEKIVEKMCHAPAECFKVKDRGYLREGYWADLALVDLNQEWVVDKSNILYKCGWSPLEGKKFRGKVDKTILNGQMVYDQHKGFLGRNAMRMKFRSE